MPGCCRGVCAFCFFYHHPPPPSTMSRVRMGRWIKPINWNVSVSVCKAPRKVHLIMNCSNERWAVQSLMSVLLVFQAEVNVATRMSDSALQNCEVSPLQSNLALSEVIKTKCSAGARLESNLAVYYSDYCYFIISVIETLRCWPNSILLFFCAYPHPASRLHFPVSLETKCGHRTKFSKMEREWKWWVYHLHHLLKMKLMLWTWALERFPDVPRTHLWWFWWGQGSFWGIVRVTEWEEHSVLLDQLEKAS